MNRYLYILTISFSLFCSSVFAQTIEFDMFAFGGKIGTMVITRIVERDGSEYYTLESKTKAKVLWIDKVGYTKYDVRFKDGKLITSSHVEKENGIIKRWTKVSFDGKKYDVDSYKGKSTFTTPPTYCVLSLYFKDFKNRKQIFYEAEGDFSTVSYPTENAISFKSSDGNKNTYFFENGAIKGMEFQVSIATVKAIRTK